MTEKNQLNSYIKQHKKVIKSFLGETSNKTGEVEVATIQIGSDTNPYGIFLKKVSATPNNPVIDTTHHKIIVEVDKIPEMAADITAAIEKIKVGGTASRPTYDSDGKSLTCKDDFDKTTSPVTCNQVTGFPKTILDQVRSILGQSDDGTDSAVMIKEDKKIASVDISAVIQSMLEAEKTTNKMVDNIVNANLVSYRCNRHYMI